MQTLTYSTVRRLPEINGNMAAIRQCEFSVGFWQHMYADAGSQKEQAWRMYGDAVDNEQPREVILSLYDTAQLYDEICRGAWGELETAKKNLLVLYN